MAPGTSTLLVVALLTAVVGLWVHQLFAIEVPEPYMDEVFHIPQAQAYCRRFPAVGSVPHDPKITTFPGVYLVSALASALTRVSMDMKLEDLGGECSVGFLRGVNAVLACLGAGISYGLVVRQRARCKLSMEKTDDEGRERWSGDDDMRSAIDVALATAFPLHAFFVWLFYTDTASTVFVLATWLALVEKRHTLSGILAGCSILMRQTNAVWVVCLVGWDVADAALAGRGLAPSLGLGGQMMAIVRYMRSNVITCVYRYYLHATAVFAFASFVVWNGGIVVGDRANHAPVLHWVQPFYFYAFLVISTGPLWFGRVSRAGRAGRAGTFNCLSPRVVALWSSLGSLVVLAFLAVDWGTLVHPFLLADNRHYTFYLWRRVIGASDWSRYLAAPVYAGCAWLALLSPPLDQPVVPAIKTLMLVFCTAFVLTPAHLVEFRYFTIPWYLHVLRPGGVMYDDQRRGTTAVVVLKVITLLGYIALNAATIHVFLYKSFSWGDGSVARFMW